VESANLGKLCTGQLRARENRTRRPGRRLQEVETYSTMTRPLLGLADRLRCLGVTRVVMEATSDYVRREGA
jgi:transposase